MAYHVIAFERCRLLLHETRRRFDMLRYAPALLSVPCHAACRHFAAIVAMMAARRRVR